MTVTAVGFDLDDTLAVADRDRSTLLAEAIEVHDGPPISRDDYLEAHRRHLTAETREPIFADLLAGRPADVSPGELSAAYRDRVNASLRPVDGIDRLLVELRDRYRVGLLTNGPVAAQRTKLAELGLTEAFDAVVISGELAAGKPDPGAFDALLERLGNRAEETAYVGDEIRADVIGAAAAGLRSVQVCYPGGPGPHPTAEATVDRETLATDLPAILAAL